MDILLALLMFASLIACGIFILFMISRAFFRKGMPVKKSAILLGVSFVILIVSTAGFGAVAEPAEDVAKTETKQATDQREVAKEKQEDEEKAEKAQEAENEKQAEEKSETAAALTIEGKSSSNSTVDSKTTSKSTDTSGTTEQIPVTLVKTIDGDTIKILYDGKEQNVRYLLIDTPETSHPRLGKQPFGEEAKNRNKQLVNSGKLTIEFDVGERVDKYGRLLAYVYVDGKSVQQTLLEEGMARVAYVYPPNTRHLTPFEQAQERAKEKKIGIWSIENYATDSGFNGSVPASSAAPSSKTEVPASNPAPKPTPTPTPAASTEQAKEYFQNCTELRKVYPNGVPAEHPAYQPKMDRDKDGYACER